MTKKTDWDALRSIPPGKMLVAKQALLDVRQGMPVVTALRRNTWQEAPLHKSALVAAYYELVELGNGRRTRFCCGQFV